MAVISIKELHQRRRSSFKDGKRSETRVFQVKCNDIHDGTAVALTAKILNGEGEVVVKVPTYGDGYPGLPTCVASSIDASPVPNSGVHFEVTVEYTDGDLEQPPVHPLERPPEWSWGASESTEAYFLDRSSPPKPCVNSAGDSFESFFERESGCMTITMVRNEATHDANVAETYSHTSNNHIVTLDGTGYAIGTLKLSPIQAQKVTEVWQGQTITFYRRTYTFKARRDGWKDRPLDFGFNSLRETTKVIDDETVLIKERLPIVDAAGLRVQKPWPLDGTGKAKPSATDKPAELEFLPYTERSWADLDLA